MTVESQLTTFYWNAVKLGEVVSGTGPTGAAAVIDVSHLESTAVEKLISIPDEGQYTFDVNWLSADVAQDALRADRASRTKRAMTIHLRDISGTILTFDAYCMDFALSTGVGQQAKGSITVEIDEAVNYSPRLLQETAYNEGTGVLILDLEEDTFAAAGSSENVANWTWAYGGSGLVISTVVRTTATQATLTYTTGGAGTGTFVLTVQAKAAALTGSFPSGIFRETVTLT